MRPRSLADQIVRFALSIFVAALLFYGAVCLIRDVWPWLLGVTAAVVGAAVTTSAIRWRRERW